ncbi:MAG TPA: hypothetical protein VF950_06450 [Planctomycetota bacterium]
MRDYRDILRGLREAPVPPCPEIRPAAPERPRVPWGLAAAAAMLLALVLSLYPRPAVETPTPAAVSARISDIEARVSALRHEELRSLLERELALLRRELELAR